MAARDPELWRCPECGRTFAAHGQVHTCAALGELDRHFEGCEPSVRATFDAVLAAVRELGPVEVLAEKTRIALHARMSFAALMPRRAWLRGHLVLARELHSPRFTAVHVFSRQNVLHEFRLDAVADVDEEFRGWLAEAYDVGQQRHHRTAG